MIRQLARWLAEAEVAAIPVGQPIPDNATLQSNSTRKVFNLHPEQILRLLEEAWAYAPVDAEKRPDVAIPDALLYGLVPGLESGIRDLLPGVASSVYDAITMPRNPGPLDSGRGATWDHLIYAYFIENTRAFEIMTKVASEYLNGERLEVPSPETHRWLRTTEALFFRSLPTSSMGALTSDLRPDLGAIRRNAYLRLFGMDLNHGSPDGRPYPFVRAAAINAGFVSRFEDFLREVWIASENARNSSGSNPKDDSAIANYARDMADMLTTRRQRGNLAREEFFIVTMMSWFHLTLESNTSVVLDCKAQATSPEERLRKMGERVGIAPHANAESFFVLASRMSTLLTRLEAGAFSNPATVSVLYANPVTGPPNPVRKDMLDIINQWSISTGRDMKARRTTVTPRVASSVVAQRNGAVRAPAR